MTVFQCTGQWLVSEKPRRAKQQFTTLNIRQAIHDKQILIRIEKTERFSGRIFIMFSFCTDLLPLFLKCVNAGI